jgi:hypothetical protein
VTAGQSDFKVGHESVLPICHAISLLARSLVVNVCPPCLLVTMRNHRLSLTSLRLVLRIMSQPLSDTVHLTSCELATPWHPKFTWVHPDQI